jgi:hypothetical protein
VTNWIKLATSKTAAGLESGLAMMSTPVQIFAAGFDSMLMKAWATMIGAVCTGARDANRY